MGTSMAPVVDAWSSVENVRFVKESSLGTKITLDAITGINKTSRGLDSQAKKEISVPKFTYFGDEVSPPISDFLKETRNPVLEARTKARNEEAKLNGKAPMILGVESYYSNCVSDEDVSHHNLRNMGGSKSSSPWECDDDIEIGTSFSYNGRSSANKQRTEEIYSNDLDASGQGVDSNVRINSLFNVDSGFEERTLGDGQESFRLKEDGCNSAKNIYSNVNKKEKASKNRRKDENCLLTNHGTGVSGNVNNDLCKFIGNEVLGSSLRNISDVSGSSFSSTEGATTDTNLSNIEAEEDEQLSIEYLTRLRDSLADTFDSIEGSDEKNESDEQSSSDKNSSTESGNSKSESKSSSSEENRKDKHINSGSSNDIFDDSLRFTTKNPAFMLNSKRHNKGFFKRTRSDLHLSNHRPASKHLNPSDLMLRRSKSFLNPPVVDPLGPLKHQVTLANVDLIRQNYLNSVNQVNKVKQVDRLQAAEMTRSTQLHPAGDLDYALQAQVIQRLRQQQILKQQQIQLQHQQQIQKQQQLINQIRQQRYLQVQKQKLLQGESKVRKDLERTRSRSRGRKDNQRGDRSKREDGGRKSRSSGKENVEKNRGLSRSKSKERSRSRPSDKERSRKARAASRDALSRNNRKSIRDHSNGFRTRNVTKSCEKEIDKNEPNNSPLLKHNLKDNDDDDNEPEDGPIYATIATSHKTTSKVSAQVSNKFHRSRTLSPTPRETSRQISNKTRKSPSPSTETSASKKRMAPSPPIVLSKKIGVDAKTENSKSATRDWTSSSRERRSISNSKLISSEGDVSGYHDCPYTDPLDKLTDETEDGPIAQARRSYLDNMKRIKTVDAPMRGGGPSSHQHAHHHRGTRSDRSSVDGASGAPGGAGGGDDASSVGSESYAKDVAILNCCFDDIERFIARLQHTAAATQELEKRRRSRKNKKKEVGDGLLSMRAKPPPEIEFVEILQKFKLSFNMLGKLRTYIHEPNAPELVHFIFTPLALIVDASRDSNYGTNLPAKVVSPLLTQEAVDLLTNCLSSRETELWQSLDDAWIIPREHWKFPVPPYRPVFSSGWAPELSDEPRDPRAELKGRSREEYDDYYQSKASPPPDRYPRHHPYPESEVSGSESASGPEGPGAAGPPQHQWLAELRRRGSRIVQVTYPRTANNDKELTVVRGEYLEVLDDSRKWWRCGNSRGQKAHVPHTIVTPFTPAMLNEGMAGAPTNDWGPKDKALGSPLGFFSRSTPSLPSDCSSSGFCSGGYHGATSSDDEDSNPPPRHYKNPKPPATPIPKPPPPPPPDFTPGNTIVERQPRKMPVNSQQIFGSTRESSDLVTFELKGVLEEFRKRKPHIEVQKTPDVYVDNRATPAEVQEWMQKKNFSERVRKQFEGVDGAKLFSLSKDQLKSFCGESDGNRLFSQITIQRNVSGYKTVNTHELKRILQEQRKRVDTDPVDNVSQNFSFLKDYTKSELESGEESEKEEAPVVRKPKKSKDPNKKKSSSSSPAKSASKSSSSSSTPAPLQPNTPPRPVASTSKPPPGAKPKASGSGGKKKPETGTLKDQIKKQRRKIIYKTDDDDDDEARPHYVTRTLSPGLVTETHEMETTLSNNIDDESLM